MGELRGDNTRISRRPGTQLMPFSPFVLTQDYHFFIKIKAYFYVEHCKLPTGKYDRAPQFLKDVRIAAMS